MKQQKQGGGGVDASLATAMKKAVGSRGGNKAQLAMMQMMMDQMFGGAVPTLRTIIGDHQYEGVSPKSSVYEAAQHMAAVRKGVLVMEDGAMVGILTPKDLLFRVVSKELSVEETLVEEVMTENPAWVSPDLTLLEALREMHDQKFLHLAVVEADGTVLGLLNVMELMCSVGGGEGGGKSWREFFSGAMDARGDDDSETGSLHGSERSKGYKAVPKPPPSASKGSVIAAAAVAPASTVVSRSVSKLRPKSPLTVLDSASVLEVAQAMAASRVDAVLLVSERGGLMGILTDNDVTKRVVSVALDPQSTSVGDVMTKGPKCVRNEDSALDALDMMVANKFRHLPVLDKNGAVVGVLDIAKCLYDGR